MHSLDAKNPEFELIGNSIKVTLYPMDSKAGEGANEGVNSRFTLIKENEGKRAPFFASALQTARYADSFRFHRQTTGQPETRPC